MKIEVFNKPNGILLATLDLKILNFINQSAMHQGKWFRTNKAIEKGRPRVIYMSDMNPCSVCGCTEMYTHKSNCKILHGGKMIADNFENIQSGLLKGDGERLKKFFPNEDAYARVVRIAVGFFTNQNIPFTLRENCRYWEDLSRFTFNFSLKGDLMYERLPKILIPLVEQVSQETSIPYTDTKCMCTFKTNGILIRLAYVVYTTKTDETTYSFYANKTTKQAITTNFYAYDKMSDDDKEELRKIWNRRQ
jgi:hypothetical protein